MTKNNYSISWVLVNSLGKLKFSKSSYYYIVIIPVLVKALEKVNNPFTIKVGESDIQLTLELPFSWYLFYFGAVAIAIGSTLYQLFCPDLIKNYKNYGEFLEAGESDNYLENVSKRYNLQPFYLRFLEQPYIEKKTKEKIENEPKNKYEESTFEEHEVVVDYKHNIKYYEDRKNSFNKIYNEIKFSKKQIRYLSFSLYIIGFSAFTWVIIENIYFVIKHLM